jgi:hypothetical protein
MRIRLFTLMRIRIRLFTLIADPDPTSLFDTDPDPPRLKNELLRLLGELPVLNCGLPQL